MTYEVLKAGDVVKALDEAGPGFSAGCHYTVLSVDQDHNYGNDQIALVRDNRGTTRSRFSRRFKRVGIDTPIAAPTLDVAFIKAAITAEFEAFDDRDARDALTALCGRLGFEIAQTVTTIRFVD